MIWVNLLQDTLASLSLATELPSDDLLRRKPYGRQQHIVSPIMMRNIISHSVYQLVILFYMLFAGTVKRPTMYMSNRHGYGRDQSPELLLTLGPAIY